MPRALASSLYGALELRISSLHRTMSAWSMGESGGGSWPRLSSGALGAGRARVLVVASNEEYGRILPGELPLRETSPLRPDSPYGVSKVAQDMLGLSYFLSYGLGVVRVRPFNHIGPRQNDRFVASAFARQIAEIEAAALENNREIRVMKERVTLAKAGVSPATAIGRQSWIVSSICSASFPTLYKISMSSVTI